MLHLVVKENPAWGREKGGCLPQAIALRMTAAVEATLRNWELAADVRTALDALEFYNTRRPIRKNQDGGLVPGDFDEMHAMYFHTEKELVKPVLGTINVWVQQFLFIAKMF
ncbi:hypothetical protein P5673_029240 [Acropora cervicornis]|uniref:Uncharacterized protein n=1 Tax=Acropora cervicornis TaxID=6130 RepID=A0AAD9PWD4_ACRCE|nr:hypothetical protein P5673_029240 [Acropora cervicornis]